MTADRDVLELECQLRITDAVAKLDPEARLVPADLISDGFWEGVRAATHPRSATTLQGLLEMRRVRASGSTK